MRRRADPRQIGKLVEVQHARRAAADVALAAARDDERNASLEKAAAIEKASTAQDDWLAIMARPGFAPDYALALAGRLVAREAAADEAGETHRIAIGAHLGRQDDWRLSEAHVKLTEASLAQARRDAARDREEKRLGELSDRVTYTWMRP